MKSALPLALLATAACASSGAAPPERKPVQAVVLTPTEKDQVLEARQQRQAQRAWCNYLDELWVRTAHAPTADPALDVPGAAMPREVPRHWPRFEQCLEVTTTASPVLLRKTADCSLAALRRVQGDPFTPAHAAEVSRCGAEAIQGMQVSKSELEPFVSTICTQVSSCGEIGMMECSTGLREQFGPDLERAVGAINSRGRTELKACLKGVPCRGAGGHIAGCLEPLMENLIWLPD